MHGVLSWRPGRGDKRAVRLARLTSQPARFFGDHSGGFVPECVKADVLFRNMKRTHNTLAVVLDEYGGVAGIITINDLVEQLVGAFEEDELVGKTAPLIEAAGPEAWKIHGDAPLQNVARALGVALPTDDYDTFNGLVFGALGTIPPDGAAVEVETAGLRIKVTEIRNHQVETAMVYLKNSACA